jgi:hypothetical protein
MYFSQESVEKYSLMGSLESRVKYLQYKLSSKNANANDNGTSEENRHFDMVHFLDSSDQQGSKHCILTHLYNTDFAFNYNLRRIYV